MFRFSLAALCSLALLITAPAAAYWTGQASGTGSATTAAMPAGNQPSTSVSGQSVTVSWTQNSFLGSPLTSYAGGGYTVKRYASGATLAQTPNASCATTLATNGCVEAGVPYGAWQYAVTPVLHSFVGAQGTKSATVQVVTAAPVLSAPSALNPTAGQTTGSIQLSWSSVTGATGYNVYRGTASGSYGSSPLNGSPQAGTTYTDAGSGLSSATTYYYVIRAVAGSPTVESANSNVLSAATISRPAAPSGVTATATVAAHVSVAWSAVSGATGYNVYRRTAAGSYDLAAPRNGASTVAASPYDDTAVNASSYNYVVRAVIVGAGGAQVESASSTESASVTADGLPPGAPTTLTVTSGGGVTSTTSCGVTSGTRFINNAGKSTVGVTVTVTAAPETGETFVFSATTPGSPTFTTTVPATGTSVSTTLDLSSTELLNGVVTLTVQSKDIAGNLSANMAPGNAVIKDTVAPITVSATFHLLGGAPLGTGAHVDGTSECGAVVSVQKTTGGTINTATAAANGGYDVGLGVLNGGTFNVWSTDLAGNVGAAITA